MPNDGHGLIAWWLELLITLAGCVLIFTGGVALGKRLERRNELARRIAAGPPVPPPAPPAPRDVLIGCNQVDAEQHYRKWAGPTPIMTAMHRADQALAGMPIADIYLTEQASNGMAMVTLRNLREQQHRQVEPGQVFRLAADGQSIAVEL